MGIDTVNKWLAQNRLFFLRDALVEADYKLAMDDGLVKERRPQSLLQELGSYEWGITSKDIPTDEPVKKNDHACDALRYGIMSLEMLPSGQSYNPRLDIY